MPRHVFDSLVSGRLAGTVQALSATMDGTRGSNGSCIGAASDRLGGHVAKPRYEKILPIRLFRSGRK